MPSRSAYFPALLLALGLAVPTAQAQTVASAPADTAHYYKHHLGLTASPVLEGFFTANRSLPVGLLYKRQTAPNKIWRFGLVLNQDYSRRDENNTPPLPAIKANDEYVYNTWGVSASVGREYAKAFSRRWTGTAGADLSLGFSRYTHEFSYQRADNVLGTRGEYRQVDRFRYYQAALTPFVGLRYTIWPSLYITAESAISLAYKREVIDSRSKDINLITGVVNAEKDFGPQNVTDQDLNVAFKFINQLTLHYVLGKW